MCINLDPTFLKLRNLIDLNLSGNNISLLTKPSSTIATHPKFEALFLAFCELSEFPDFLKNQDESLYLDLSHNKIHGQIPKWVWNLSKETLSELYLDSNSLTGFDQLPVFPTSTILWTLDLVLTSFKVQSQSHHLLSFGIRSQTKH
jgi:hypothetical protein